VNASSSSLELCVFEKFDVRLRTLHPTILIFRTPPTPNLPSCSNGCSNSEKPSPPHCKPHLGRVPRPAHSHVGLTLSLRRVANVAGTQEPIYGPSAIRSVAEEAKTTPYTELTRDDLKWQAMDSTCVETQTFYIMADNGQLAFVQVIYSNVA